MPGLLFRRILSKLENSMNDSGSYAKSTQKVFGKGKLALNRENMWISKFHSMIPWKSEMILSPINLKQRWQTFCNFSNLCQLLSNFHKSKGKKLGKPWSWISSMISWTFCNFQEILIYRQLFYRLVTIISLSLAEKIKVKFSSSLLTVIIIKHDKINQENKNILIKKAVADNIQTGLKVAIY